MEFASPPGSSPVDEFEQRSEHRKNTAQRWIAKLNRWWLLGQVAGLGLLCAGGIACSGAWIAGVLIIASWGLTIAAAAGSAGVALWNWSVLPRIWLVIGLAPWAILLMEVTVIAAGLL